VSENVLWKVFEIERDLIVNSGSHNQEFPYSFHSSKVYRAVLHERDVQPS